MTLASTSGESSGKTFRGFCAWDVDCRLVLTLHTSLSSDELRDTSYGPVTDHLLLELLGSFEMSFLVNIDVLGSCLHQVISTAL